MRASRSLLLTLAACAAPLAAGAAPLAAGGAASTAPTDLAAAAAAAKKGCAVPAPLPLLDKGRYPDHEFRYGRKNEATETASNGNVRIEIGFSGCGDGFEHSFSFTEIGAKAAYDDRDHWLDFAAAQMKALRTWRRGREDVKDLLDFLSGAKIGTTRKNGSEIRLEICRDGTPSGENGCSMKSGGGWRFAVRKMAGGAVEVNVSRSLALARPRS